MNITRKQLEILLRDWGYLVSKISTDSAFPSTTTVHKCMELGPDGACIRSGVRVEPNYWPNHMIIAINNAVFELNDDDRKILIGWRVLGMTHKEIGKDFNLSKWGITKRMRGIEDKIIRLLQ